MPASRPASVPAARAKGGGGFVAASDFVVAADAAPVRSPLRPWGLARLAVGVAYVAGGGAVAYVLFPELQALVSAASYGLLAAVGVLDAARAIVAMVVCVRGVRMMSDAIGSVTGHVPRAAAPAPLAAAETARALDERDPAGRGAGVGIGYRFVRKWFPGRMPTLTGRMRGIADVALSEVPRAARAGLLLGGAFAVLTVLPGLRDALFGGLMPSVPWTFVVLLTGTVIAHVALVVSALPVVAHRTDVRTFRASAHGVGEPARIAHGLQQELAAIGGDATTRIEESGFSLEPGPSRDGGAFSGRIVAETEPRFVGMAEPGHARTLIATGSVVQLLALAWLLGGPGDPATLTTGVSAGLATTLFYVAQLTGGWLLASAGSRAVANGGELLRGFRFESLAVLVDVRGTVTRSHLRIGRGMHDSIESDTVVMQTDACVTGRCAALLTECREPLGRRAVVAMAADERAAAVELRIQRYLWRFERQPASIAHVNLDDHGVLGLLHANLSLDAQRGAALPQATRIPTPLPPAPSRLTG